MDNLMTIQYAKMAAYFGAAFAVAIGTIGPSVSQGLIGVKGLEMISKFPENAGQIRTSMLLALGIVETASVFSLVVAILLIFINR